MVVVILDILDKIERKDIILIIENFNKIDLYENFVIIKHIHGIFEEKI